MKKNLEVQWPEFFKKTLIQFWKTFLNLEKKGAKEKENAQILSKELIEKLKEKSKVDHFLESSQGIEKIGEDQENIVAQEVQKIKEAWEKSHKKVFLSPFFSKLKERDYLWTDFQKSSEPLFPLKKKISKPYLGQSEKLLDLFKVSCKVEEAKKYLELWSEFKNQLETLIFKIDYEKEGAWYPSVKAFLKNLH